MNLDLLLLRDTFAIHRLEPAAPIPDWARGELVSITRTAAELSVVCPEGLAPDGVRAETGWRCLQVAGALDFNLIGVIASLSGALAEAGISVLGLSSFDTDFVLVRARDLDNAVRALQAAGHQVRAA